MGRFRVHSPQGCCTAAQHDCPLESRVCPPQWWAIVIDSGVMMHYGICWCIMGYAGTFWYVWVYYGVYWFIHPDLVLVHLDEG